MSKNLPPITVSANSVSHWRAQAPPSFNESKPRLAFPLLACTSVDNVGFSCPFKYSRTVRVPVSDTLYHMKAQLRLFFSTAPLVRFIAGPLTRSSDC